MTQEQKINEEKFYASVVPQFQESIDSTKKEFFALLETMKDEKQREQLIKVFNNTPKFFTDPAGTAYHSAFPGGLATHTLLVMKKALDIRQCAEKDQKEGLLTPGFKVPSYDEVLKAAALHDVCKINTYAIELKWKKDDRGRWYQYPGYVKSDNLPVGHGEKSVIWSLLKGIGLTKDEMLGIRWHMGRYEAGSDTSAELKTFYEATKQSMMPAILHEADNYAAKFFEVDIDMSKYSL